MLGETLLGERQELLLRTLEHVAGKLAELLLHLRELHGVGAVTLLRAGGQRGDPRLGGAHRLARRVELVFERRYPVGMRRSRGEIAFGGAEFGGGRADAAAPQRPAHGERDDEPGDEQQAFDHALSLANTS